jgi:hypothetical protein
VVCNPILVFSFSFDQAEQNGSHKCSPEHHSTQRGFLSATPSVTTI